MIDQGDGGCATETDCNPTSEVDIIASVIATGNRASGEDKSYYRQLAVELAIKAYDIQFASPDVNVGAYSSPEDYLTRPGINLGYQPLFYGGGLTHNVPGLGTNMKIGESAFTTPGWLGSTIGHENEHLQQALDGTLTNVEPGSSQNEVDAYN